ncbi:3-dehydroquinate synthase [Terrimonas sp.]|uniref:3-dehydroquinate synthase n=1 Tax=Terrimonas sp. TaxID=1914338 RepID=UPI000D50AA50|nr:3-dehydroquinate synthase [Terrimonas sp.]PVD53534.1 3-dehydroquinate synthase [Terrimonas sp.]
MTTETYSFSKASTTYYFDATFAQLKKIVDIKSAIIITDENLFKAHPEKFKNWNTIVLRAGEQYKIQATVDTIIEQMLNMEADRKTTLIGIGGGVITDITGYVASIYMRGIPFGFVPTSVLAMVDASIGGKNGIDVGVYKNMVGIIRQPSFILHDLKLLDSLSLPEWQNGFAEIIKHAAIKDAPMFAELEKNTIDDYRKDKKKMASLIHRNALIKIKIVQKDEFEKGDRKLLNYGHTLGHALENQYELSHGQAIAIGMTYAAEISAKLRGFKQTEKIVATLEKYGLPTYAEFNKKKAIEVLKMDKKRVRKEMNYILLDKIGKGVIHTIPLTKLDKIIMAL